MLRKLNRAGGACVILVLALVAGSAEGGLVDLEFRPGTQTIEPDEIAEVGLYAISQEAEGQSIAAIGLILLWDTTYLELVGKDDTGAVPRTFSGFPMPDIDHLNDTFEDGDAYYEYRAPFFAPAMATPEGILITTLQFRGVAETPETIVDTAPEAGYFTETVVFDGDVPNRQITGEVGHAAITIGSLAPPPLVVNVELLGVHTPVLERCIRFELWSCDAGASTAVVDYVMQFTSDGVGNAMGSAVIDIPYANYTCITAQDRLHSLRRTDEGFYFDGSQYVADFTGDPASGGDALVGGNLNDDFWVDIIDYGVYTWQWASQYTDPDSGEVTGSTGCSTAYPHADASGDGNVTAVDFTFIYQAFLVGHEANCCEEPGLAMTDGPRMAIALDELAALGLESLAVGDLNGDGWLDVEDVAAFAAGVRPKAAGRHPLGHEARGE